jgi:hypothetical protein
MLLFFYACGFLYQDETMTGEAITLDPADRGHTQEPAPNGETTRERQPYYHL